jgi:plasmid stability protein
MAVLAARHVPSEVRPALRVRAAADGRGAEAEAEAEKVHPVRLPSERKDQTPSAVEGRAQLAVTRMDQLVDLEKALVRGQSRVAVDGVDVVENMLTEPLQGVFSNLFEDLSIGFSNRFHDGLLRRARQTRRLVLRPRQLVTFR